MLTPLDIQNKTFKKALHGYAAQEVEEFLNFVIADYEKLYKENAELREKNGQLKSSLKQYKAIEDTLQSALVTAQGTSAQVQHNANEAARNIIAEAENKRQRIIDSAHEEVRSISYQYEEMKRQLDTYRVKMTVLLEAQLEMLKKTKVPTETLTQLSGIDEALRQAQAEPIAEKPSMDDFLNNRGGAKESAVAQTAKTE